MKKKKFQLALLDPIGRYKGKNFFFKSGLSMKEIGWGGGGGVGKEGAQF